MTILLALAFFASPVRGAKGLADTVVPETTLVDSAFTSCDASMAAHYLTGCEFCEFTMSMHGMLGGPSTDALYACCVDKAAYESQHMETAFPSWMAKSGCTGACTGEGHYVSNMNPATTWWDCKYV